MNRIRLNNGIEIPQLGIGGWAQKAEEIAEAIRQGYRLIDTAAQYGNEEEVGKAVRSSDIGREEVFLTSKLWTEDIRQRRTGKAFEESLKRLKTDYLDLFLIHWPAEGYQEAWLEMEKLYAEGRVRSIGVSNFEPHHLKALIDAGAEITPAVNQVELHPYFSNREVSKACKDSRIYMEAWCPLGGPGSGEMKDETIAGIADSHGKTPAQIILRWHIQNDVIVIPKSSKVERMKENFDVFDFSLSEEEMRLIDALERGKRLGAHPDHFDF